MRLEATRKADLAAQAMVVLGGMDGRLKGTELADKLGATASYMPQVLSPLVERGWVQSDPGPTGGYSITVSLDDITVLDVIEAIDGPTENGRCVVANRACDADAPCTLHSAWLNARAALLEALRTTPLRAVTAPRTPS